jgi:hypothetical protein
MEHPGRGNPQSHPLQRPKQMTDNEMLNVANDVRGTRSPDTINHNISHL